MTTKPKNTVEMLKIQIVRIARVHFYLAAALAVQIMIYDAWQLIAPQAVLQRWLIVGMLFIVATSVWMFARTPTNKIVFFDRLLGLLIAVDVVAASLLIYQTRGMASRAVMLYGIPIIVASVLKRRTVIFGTALFCIAAYVATAVAYFVWNFNEGYKIELYGEIGLYSALMLIFAGLLWAVHNPAKKD